MARLLSIVFVSLFLTACLPSEWRTVTNPDAAKRADLVERGWLSEVLAENADRLIVTYQIDANQAFVRAVFSPANFAAFNALTIPAEQSVAAALANEHPPVGLEGWDEVTLQARLRTGTLPVRRPRDGSTWRYASTERGDLWAWYVPDVID
ncbi:MAG: hypothetical protein AAGA88_05450 [Pseudomonadota bacterium]